MSSIYLNRLLLIGLITNGLTWAITYGGEKLAKLQSGMFIWWKVNSQLH